MTVAVGKYGFGGDTVVLPPPSPRRQRAEVDGTSLAQAVTAGHHLGFVPRDPMTEECRPRPRRREPRNRLTVSGPARVTQAFRNHCARRDVPFWEGLEELLEDRTHVRPDSTSDGVAIPFPAGQLTIALPEALAAWIEERVRRGLYADASDLVRDLIRAARAAEISDS